MINALKLPSSRRFQILRVKLVKPNNDTIYNLISFLYLFCLLKEPIICIAHICNLPTLLYKLESFDKSYRFYIGHRPVWTNKKMQSNYENASRSNLFSNIFLVIIYYKSYKSLSIIIIIQIIIQFKNIS